MRPLTQAIIAVLVALLAGCATTYRCESEALELDYGTDVEQNILLHDSAMRVCMGEQP